MGSDKFCLRWNDFESNISLAFREIREEKDFFDCTLSCGARQIQAHKLILSACSPFFRTILRQNPHQHPLLYLKGVEFTDLQAVLNFMYHGEVNVAQEELNSFLCVAEDLQVKGLTQKNGAGPAAATEKHKPPYTPATPARSQPTFTRSYDKSPKPSISNLTTPPANEDNDVQEVVPVIKQELPSQVVEPSVTPKSMATVLLAYQPSTAPQTSSYQENTVAQIEESYSNEGYDYGEFEGEGGYEEEGFVDDIGAGVEGDYSKDYTDGDSAIAALLVHQGASCYTCARCGKSSAQRTDLMKHIISKHVSTPAVNCQFCSKKYKNQNSLQVHISQNHRELWQQTKKMG